MLNRLKLTFLAALAFYFNSWNLAAQQMPDVSITKNNWQLDPGVTTTDQGLIIINGDPERYVKAQLTKNVPTVKDLYFIADVKLENVETGEEAFAHPKLKIYSIDGRMGAVNLTEDLQDQWFTTGLRIRGFEAYKTPSVTLEFSIQNAKGVLKIRNPRLSATPPPILP